MIMDLKSVFCFIAEYTNLLVVADLTRELIRQWGMDIDLNKVSVVPATQGTKEIYLAFVYQREELVIRVCKDGTLYTEDGVRVALVASE